MVETKHLKRIMKEYHSVLEKYEDRINSFSKEDIKRLIGEVRLFWYRQQGYIGYLLSNIDKGDNVTYLSGAVRLEIKNAGHNEYILVKGCRIINDPLIKMSAFYHGTDDEINFETANRYLKDCFFDLLALLREYSEDFFVIPLETITISDNDGYHKVLAGAAEQMLVSLFSNKYDSVEEMKNDNSSYEDIENHLPDWIKERLIFDSLEDSKLSIKEKCENALYIGKQYIPFMESMGESSLFFMLVTQHCMGAIATFNCMKNFKIMPYIRDDIAFQYFDLLFHSSLNDEFVIFDYLQVLVPYVLQKAFDFSKWDYETIKHKIGNGVLIDYIIAELEIEEGGYPRIADIVDNAKKYIEKVEMK